MIRRFFFSSLFVVALLGNAFILVRSVKEVRAAGETLTINAPVVFGGSYTVSSGQFIDNANSVYFLDPASTGTSLVVAGNVGIGTAGPGYKLDVSGDVNFSGKLREDGVEILSGMIAPFASACPTGWTEYTAARGRSVVGTPLSGTIAGTAGTALTNLEDRAVGQHIHSITDPGHTHAITSGEYPGDSCGSTRRLSSTPDSVWCNGPVTVPSATIGITINNAGSVAGTNAPYIQLTYCQKTAGADIAEWISGEADLSKATIVSIDPDSNEKVVASKVPYDSSAIGIISTQPGWLVGTESPGSVQLALAGRVPTRVSLVNGEIKRGDPITTSNIPGVGMKATKAGPIIGKAMEAINEQSSLIPCVDSITGKMEQCGTISVFLNVSWYDPDAYLTDTGGLTIDGVILRRITGEIVERVGAFAKIIVGHIQAGLIETKKLIVDGVDIIKKLKELSDKASEQQQEIDALKKEVELLRRPR